MTSGGGVGEDGVRREGMGGKRAVLGTLDRQLKMNRRQDGAARGGDREDRVGGKEKLALMAQVAALDQVHMHAPLGSNAPTIWVNLFCTQHDYLGNIVPGQTTKAWPCRHEYSCTGNDWN